MKKKNTKIVYLRANPKNKKDGYYLIVTDSNAQKLAFWADQKGK